MTIIMISQFKKSRINSVTNKLGKMSHHLFHLKGAIPQEEQSQLLSSLSPLFQLITDPLWSHYPPQQPTTNAKASRYTQLCNLNIRENTVHINTALSDQSLLN